MRPLIGVTCNYRNGECVVKWDYTRALERAGGVPVVLPLLDGAEVVREALSRVAGVLVTGGADIPSGRFGEKPHAAANPIAAERDTFDFLLLEQLKTLDKPTLAICYGAQALNVAFGGTLHQDILDLVPDALEHRKQKDRPTLHTVTVEKGTLLHRILGVDALETNSSHHQAISETPPPLRQVAFAADGVVEAIESTTHRFLLGIQWHPERMIDDPLHLKLFEAFIEEARK